MIKVPTVLILGAGASIPFGFPSGLQLKAEICQEIRDKHDIFRDLILFTDDEDHVQDFYNNLLLSSEMSIDAFLEHNQKYFEVGRRAIANILLRKKEKHVKLFDDWISKWLDKANKDKHWYQLLFSKLNAPFEEFEGNQLKIITFNYDRSLEYFLLKSMKAKYSEQNKEAILEKLHKVPILHIYGKLGSLPEYDSEGFYVPYDILLSIRNNKEDRWRKYIYEASRKIFTIHQAKEMESVIQQAQQFLQSANRIYFLGFGYDKINMERLFLSNGINLLKDKGLGDKCFGTALDLSPHHKVYLNRFGLGRMGQDLVQEGRGDTSSPLKFPNSTIYDFLYYNRFSRLD